MRLHGLRDRAREGGAEHPGDAVGIQAMAEGRRVQVLEVRRPGEFARVDAHRHCAYAENAIAISIIYAVTCTI
mgnify:CR=1 FL=1